METGPCSSLYITSHRHFTHREKFSVNLSCMLPKCGRKLERWQKTQAHTTWETVTPQFVSYRVLINWSPFFFFSQVKRDLAQRGCGQQKLCSHLELKRLLNRDSRVWFSVFNQTHGNCKSSTWSANNGCVSSQIPSRPVRPCHWGNNYRLQTQVCNWTCTLRAEEQKSLCVCVCVWGSAWAGG